MHFILLLLVQEGETGRGADADGGRCHRGSSVPTGCYPVLPDADGASTVVVLPDAIAPSLAATPDFARRASWSHAIEVRRLLIHVGNINGVIFFLPFLF